MDKLILKDGTSIELQDGSSLEKMQVVFTDMGGMVELHEKLTPDNLLETQIQSSDGTIIAEYTNLILASTAYVEQEDGTILTTFKLRKKTDTELLKHEVDVLKNESIKDLQTKMSAMHSKVYNIVDTETMTLDEYKEHRQEENKKALEKFLEANPLLWVDGRYYGVTQEDQNEMSLDFSTYNFKKQSVKDDKWKLQWHSTKSNCRDFTEEEFGGLLNAIVEFVYPYRQLEMQYKEQIYSATTKEEVTAVELVYQLPNDESDEVIDETTEGTETTEE